MNIYKNLWAGYESYFIRMSNSGRYARGIGVIKINGTWKVKYGTSYYASDLRHDKEHFPIVGNINLDNVIFENVMRCINLQENKEGNNGKA